MRPGQSASVVNDATRAAVDAATAKHEPACARAVARELRRLVRDAVAAFEVSTRIVHAAAFATDPDWEPPEYHVPISSDLIDEMAANESLDATTRKYREATIRTTGEAIAGDLSVQFDVSNRLLTNVIAGQSGMKIVTAPRDLVGVMMGSLQKSYDKGDSIPRAARGMREAGYAHSKPMAERIARTEIISASNGASLAMVRGGTDLRFKTWIATLDGRARPEHEQADGQVVPIDGLFDVGGEALDCPGDGSSWNSINCRCTIGYQDEPGELETLGGDDPNAGIEPPIVANMTEVRIDSLAEGVEPETLQGMFQSETLGREGLRVLADSRAMGGPQLGRIEVSGMIVDDELEVVGDLRRVLNVAKKTAEHSSFELDEELHGRGIAREMLASSVREYDRLGITRVTTTAAGENGRYTWARFGFDFDGANAVANYRSGFQARAAQIAGVNWREFAAKMPETTNLIDAAQHPWDFAGMVINENGVAMTGKQVMLSGPAWGGALDLAATSEGRAIFNAYTGQ